MTEQIGTLQPIEASDQNIPAKLDVAKRALEEATEDWQRVDIRNYARAVAAATAILERKDIQVQAANLVQDAERTIVKANPPMTAKDKQKLSLAAKREKEQQKELDIPSEESANSGQRLAEPIRDEDREIIKQDLITRNQLASMREAHSHISDEEFEAKKAKAVETGVPITQHSLRQEGREKRKTAKRQKVREQREQLIAKPPELPENNYRTIIVDPPWPMEKIEREVRPNQAGFDYPTMSIEEIAAMELPIADDAFVFLWTTQKFLPNAFQIMEAWGLKYRFTMVWHKNGGIQPYNSAQFNCEFVLVGSKGNPIFADPKAFKTAFNAPRQGHSVKPNEFYDLVERVTLSPRLDMFARREIEGFDVWGNEVC